MVLGMGGICSPVLSGVDFWVRACVKTRAFYVAPPLEFPLSVHATFKRELHIFTHKFTPLSIPSQKDPLLLFPLISSIEHARSRSSRGRGLSRILLFPEFTCDSQQYWSYFQSLIGFPSNSLQISIAPCLHIVFSVYVIWCIHLFMFPSLLKPLSPFPCRSPCSPS